MHWLSKFFVKILSWLSPTAALASAKSTSIQDPPVVNPMLSYPPNARCFCRSGRKFKACCSPKMPRLIPGSREAEARGVLEQIQALHAARLL